MQTIRYGDHESQFVEFFDASSSVEGPIGTAVMIHGGYWRNTYGADLMHPLAQHLCDRGWRVINLEYRRIGDSDAVSPWLEMRDDIALALALIDGPMTLIGHSAGGHLALWAAAALEIEVDGVVGLAPLTNLVEAARLGLSNNATGELLGGPSHDSPTTYEDASPEHRLPLGARQLIIHGADDDAVPVAMSRNYVAAAVDAGDDVTHLERDVLDHMALIDPNHAIWRDIDNWIDQRTGR